MSDPRRQRHGHPNRQRSPHAGQSLDPTLTRKGVLAHPGSLFVGAAALIFFAHVFNLGGLQTYLDRFFGGLDHSASSHTNEVSHVVISALPYLGVAAGVLLLVIVVSVLSRGARTVRRKHKLRSREEVSLHAFIQSAAAHQVSRKVAREVYHGLEPFYQHEMRVALSDQLLGTLQMKPVDISDLYGTLLRQTDRQRAVGDDAGQIVTVLDLLTAVEHSMGRSLSRSNEHEREERDAGRPVRKRPSLGQKIKESLFRSGPRKVAAVQAAEMRPRDASFVKPFRPQMKESDLAPPATSKTGEIPRPMTTQVVQNVNVEL